MEGAFVVLLVLAAIAAVAVSWWLREERRRRLEVVAGRLGLTFSASDPFGLDDRPFALFRRGDGRGCENVLHGVWRGLNATVFDYWYFEEHVNSKGHRSRTYHRFSCALMDVPLAAPHLSIGPETILSRLADHVGFRDIEFESDEFNRRVQVKSEDRRFATYLIDARMMEWLLENDGWSFEIHGNEALCAARRVAPERSEELLDVLARFRAQIPRAALDTYGGKR